MSPNPQLSFTQGDAQWTTLRARALSDLYFFVSAILGYADRIPMKESVHALLCKFVEKRTGHPALDTKRYRKIEMPREFGKTSIVTKGYTIQRICADPNISILLCNEKEQNAKDFLAAIKFEFQSNDLLRALFPEVIPRDFSDTTWSASRIIVTRSSGRSEPTVFVTGVGGSVTGMHPDLIICDDIISREAMENARAGSRQIMEQTNRWIHQLEPLLNSNARPFPEIIFIGTRWWAGDSYEHIEQAFGYGSEPQTYLLRVKLPNGEVQQVPAKVVGDLAMYRRSAIEDGRASFPEKKDMDALAKIRVMDEALFACNYLNDPSNEVTATFRETWLNYYDSLDEDTYRITDSTGAKRNYALDQLDRLLFVDPGGFSARQVEDRARAAVVVTGTSMRGEHLLLDIYSEKDTFLRCCEKVVEWAQRYAPRKIVIERAGQQAAFIELVRKALQDAGVQIGIEETKPGAKAKEMRILTLEPLFQRGAIFVGRGPNFHEFREQYRTFPRSIRLDILDTLANLPTFAKKQPRTATNTAARQAEELAAYYERRGLALP